MGKVITLNILPFIDDRTPIDVDLRIDDEETGDEIASARGQLSPIHDFGIREAYDEWQRYYKRLDPALFRAAKVTATGSSKIPDLLKKCTNAARKLKSQMLKWLETKGASWLPMQIVKHLPNSTEESRVLLKTDETWLQKLPWQEWNLLAQNAEIALSLPSSERIYSVKKTASGQVRILVILGNSDGLDTEFDRLQIEKNFSTEKVEFLSNPSPREFLKEISSQDGWDVLFFLGHSASPKLDQEEIDGEFSISPGLNISITDFKDAFRTAILNGLKVAVFNSCDGLGLANVLMQLNIPQVIVMRELIPDVAARQFLQDFLDYYSRGNSLYSSVRNAKNLLKSLEVNNPEVGQDNRKVGQFPGVSWLPIICQNPTAKPPTWNDLRRGGRYLDSVVDILENLGARQDYNLSPKISYKGFTFERFLRLPNAEMNIDPLLSFFQMKGEWDFVFTTFKRLEKKKLAQYSEICFEYCKYELWQKKGAKINSSKATQWFGHGVKVPANICFSIAIVDKADEELKHSIQTTNSLSANPIYSDTWISYSVPILYVTDENRIYYFQESSDWLNGETAWRCIRPVIEKYLSP